MKKLNIKYIFNPSDQLSYTYCKLLNLAGIKQDNLIGIDVIIGGFPIINRNLKFTKYDTEVIKKYNINLSGHHLPQKESLDLNNENFILATAMCVFKERFPEKAIEFACHIHKNNLSFDEKIKSLYQIAKISGYDELEFKNKLAEKKYKVQAYSEFELVTNKIVINAYPITIIEWENKIRVLFSGYICLNRLKEIYEVTDKRELFYTLNDVLFSGIYNSKTESVCI